MGGIGSGRERKEARQGDKIRRDFVNVADKCGKDWAEGTVCTAAANCSRECLYDRRGGVKPKYTQATGAIELVPVRPRHNAFRNSNADN